MSSMAFVHTLSGKVNNYYKGKQAVLVVDNQDDSSIPELLQSKVGLRIISRSINDLNVKLQPTKGLPIQYRGVEKAVSLAMQAMEETGLPIGIAGFIFNGNDTIAPFQTVRSELLVLLDHELNYKIFEKSVYYQKSKICREANLQVSYNVTSNLSKKLSMRLRQHCPDCNHPGWGVDFKKQGLKCSSCGLPTSEIMSCVYSCSVCNFTMEQENVDGAEAANPADCTFCSW